MVAVPLASHGDAPADHDLGVRVVAAYAGPARCSRVAGDGATARRHRRDRRRRPAGPAEQGLVLFFTGLSGSGKSTLAQAVIDSLLEHGERTVTSLDGDVVRRNLSAGLTFCRRTARPTSGGSAGSRRRSRRHGGVAVCARSRRSTPPASRSGRWRRPPAAPSSWCTWPPRSRSASGATARASTPRRAAGEIPDFTGISSPYEVPAGRRRAGRHHRPHDRGRAGRRARGARRERLPFSVGHLGRPAPVESTAAPDLGA